MERFKNRILEVIVTGRDEAILAQSAGADRLELVKDLSVGGLTPEISTIEAVLSATSIPVRVMLRANAGYELADDFELDRLTEQAATLATLSIDGLVLGFVRGCEIDQKALVAILAAAPKIKATFHRAFEATNDQIRTIESLKRMARIDRILTSGMRGAWHERRTTLEGWQRQAEPLTILVGGDINQTSIPHFQSSELREFHIGRAARMGNRVEGKMDAGVIASIRKALDN